MSFLPLRLINRNIFLTVHGKIHKLVWTESTKTAKIRPTKTKSLMCDTGIYITVYIRTNNYFIQWRRLLKNRSLFPRPIVGISHAILLTYGRLKIAMSFSNTKFDLKIAKHTHTKFKNPVWFRKGSFYVALALIDLWKATLNYRTRERTETCQSCNSTNVKIYLVEVGMDDLRFYVLFNNIY